jgi:hypothetical protein
MAKKYYREGAQVSNIGKILRNLGSIMRLRASSLDVAYPSLL